MLTGNFHSVALSALWFMALPGYLAAQPESEWNFRVLLDDREIGHHHFAIREEGDIRRLFSEAKFEVHFLFVKLFEYEHRNEEVWKGDCLDRIESSTDSNGKSYSVSGQRRGERFLVRGSEGDTELPACVMSFAYWNPEFLKRNRLLNSQNGEFLSVEVAEPEPDLLNHRGSAWPARRYRLRAGDMDLVLWYSEQDDWLALETAAPGGRKLRYERM